MESPLNQRLRRSPPDVVYTPIDVTSSLPIIWFYLTDLSLMGLYIGLVSVVWRGWRTIKRQQDQLREVNVQLEARIAERTTANELLTAEVAERKRIEEGIRSSLAEKEVLLSEIHHRVKNKLQVITSLLDLQARNVEGEDIVSVLRDSHNRILSMALVHEQLYQSPDLAKIDFSDYLGSVAASMCDSYGVNGDNIKVNVHAGHVVLDVERAIPCGLIVTELISNALKHAFTPSGRGEINVDLRLAQIHRRDDYAAAERAIGAREGDGPGTIWGRGGPVSVFSCRGETL